MPSSIANETLIEMPSIAYEDIAKLGYVLFCRKIKVPNALSQWKACSEEEKLLYQMLALEIIQFSIFSKLYPSKVSSYEVDPKVFNKVVKNMTTQELQDFVNEISQIQIKV